MEEIEDLFKNIVWAEPEYTAVYDPESGSLHCIGPKSVLENEKYTIDVDRETAEMIIEGNAQEVQMHPQVREVYFGKV